MSTKSRPLTKAEIQHAIQKGQIPFSASTRKLAELLDTPWKTVLRWRELGRFEGTYRRRGKRYVFITERALQAFFNGPNWNDDGE